MRIADPDGAWIAAPRRRPPARAGPGVGRARRQRRATGSSARARSSTTTASRSRRRRPPEGLDLNRNFPAGWGTGVHGSGDHPLSEPEIAALVRAIVARPNVCGYNAFHTSGGVLLRPSSTQPDSALPPLDVWVWKQLGELGTRLTGYPVHAVFEDFTWDKAVTMSGAADDWAYEHLGVYSWTTEFWDRHPRRDRHQAVDATSGTSARPTSRPWPCCAGSTSTRLTSSSTGTRSSIRSSAPSSSAAGRTWALDQPPLEPAEGGGHAARHVRRGPGVGVPAPGDPPHAGRRPRWRHVADRGRRRQHRLAADAGVERAAKEHLVRPIVAEVARRRRDRRRRTGPDAARSARRPRLGALQRTGATARRTACWPRGSSGPSPAPR